ncbi:MAG: aspartate kinase [Bacteroidales bacterium]
MKVLKFGGSSVANAENILRVKSIVEQSPENKIIVVSALGGVTDQLIELSKRAITREMDYRPLLHQIEQRHFAMVREIIEPSKQEKVLDSLKQLFRELKEALEKLSQLRTLTAKLQDYIVSFGERLSAFLLHQIISDSLLMDARSLIKTNSQFGKAEVDFEKTYQICQSSLGDISSRIIIGGFIASDANGDTTTLGRGGSDYTAAIIAAVMDASCAEIWTDVDGVMTADPRKIENAYPVPRLSYEEVFELSKLGAKVVYPPTVQPLWRENIPMWIKNTFNPNALGTKVDAVSASNQSVKSLSLLENVVLFRLTGERMVKCAERCLKMLSLSSIHLLFPPNVSTQDTCSFALLPEYAPLARPIIEEAFCQEIAQNKLHFKQENELAMLAIVGENINHSSSLLERLQNVLKNHQVKIIQQIASKRSLAIIIHKKNIQKILPLIHNLLFIDSPKQTAEGEI